MKKLLFSLLPRPQDLAVSPCTCTSLRHKCAEASTLLAGILFVLFSCPTAFAQKVSSLGKLGTERVDSVKKMVVDTAKLRLLYKCTYHPDTTNLKREGEAWRLLQVGRMRRKSGRWGQSASIRCVMPQPLKGGLGWRSYRSTWVHSLSRRGTIR